LYFLTYISYFWNKQLKYLIITFLRERKNNNKVALSLKILFLVYQTGWENNSLIIFNNLKGDYQFSLSCSHLPHIYILLLFGIIASFALSVLIVLMYCPFLKYLIWCFICSLLLLNIHNDLSCISVKNRDSIVLFCLDCIPCSTIPDSLTYKCIRFKKKIKKNNKKNRFVQLYSCIKLRHSATIVFKCN
jgi:hypothetical protein